MTAPAPQCQPNQTELRQRLRAMPSSLNDACRTMDEAADRIEELEAALREIASFDDEHGERHLTFHGSYAGFDEPSSVKLARTALGSKP